MKQPEALRLADELVQLHGYPLSVKAATELRRLHALQATGTEAKVCADIAARQAMGLSKYGVSVQDNDLSLREWLQHAYEESLDHAIYLKRAMEELDK